MTLQTYANNEIKAGRMVVTAIEASTFGNGFWIVDKDWKTIDKAFFANKESAEKARSKAITNAVKRFA